ncbi:MAG: RNA polymerase sigma factor [Verrucomicrobiia bacterium]
MQNNDQEALFKTWLDQYGRLILKIARAYTVMAEDREDLVQEILLQMWCSMSHFEGRSNASTWVYRVALNTALGWRRKETKRRAPQVPLIEVEELPGTEENHARRLDGEEVVARLYNAIHQLPKVDAALVLLYLDDLSYREMAEVLGISESNVGVKLNRAKQVLADLMKEVTHEA